MGPAIPVVVTGSPVPFVELDNRIQELECPLGSLLGKQPGLSDH